MTLPLSVSGQQFIAGRRVASGEATLPSLRAADGKLTGYHFYPTPLPTSWICSARIFSP